MEKILKIVLPALVVGGGAWLLYLYNTPYIAYTIGKPVNADDQYIEHFMVSYWHPKLSILPVPAKYRNLAYGYNEKGLETKFLIENEAARGEFIAPYHIEVNVSYKDDMTVVTYQGT